MDRFCEYALRSGIQFFTGHCTGDKNIEYLHGRLGESLHRLSTGDELGI